MTALRNFAFLAAGAGGAWLLWRVNQAIDDQALLLVFGIVLGLAAAAVVAVGCVVIAQTRRDAPRTEAPQTPAYTAPVVILLGGGAPSQESPYSPPAWLLEAPAGRMVGERPDWVVQP